MSARKTLPIGIIIMILMMALAALGVGYAWWTEQLTATGTIQTGSIDVQIEGIGYSTVDPLNTATCSFKPSGDGKTMTISIGNAYPGYICTINFNLINYGSVPAKITGVTLPSSQSEFSVTPSGVLVTKDGLNPSSDELSSFSQKPAQFIVEINPSAGQKSSYTFEVGIDIAQGNAP